MVNPMEAASIDLDPSNKVRDRYLARRKFIETHFLENPLHTDNVKIDDADVLVLSSICEVPPELKGRTEEDKIEDPSKSEISLFIPGIYDEVLEARLAGSLLTGNADSVMVLKAEGRNLAAYKTISENIVSRAALSIFLRQLSGYLEAHNEVQDLSLNIVGNSEGGTLGASILARFVEWLREHRLDELTSTHRQVNLSIDKFIAISGSGLAGEKDLNAVNPLDHFHRNKEQQAQYLNRPHPETKLDKKGPYTPDTATHEVNVPAQLINNYEIAVSPQGLTDIKERENLFAVVWNRLLESGLNPKVMYERLRAIFGYNPDFETLFNAPEVHKLFIVTNTADTFFDPFEAKRRVDEIVKRGGEQAWRKTTMIQISEGPHGLPHANPNGLAYLLETLAQRE